MAKNSKLHKARVYKNDEFYTSLVDVESELKNYKDFFHGKKVLCNCNDDTNSSFFKYFSINFYNLGLEKLTCVSYNKEGHAVKYVLEKDNEDITIKKLNGNGDFRDDECIELLKDADVVVTNPPFSLFSEFISLMMEFKKKFIVMSNMNAVTYKEVFPYIKNNKIWYGPSISSGDRVFRVPDEYELNAANCGFDENGNKFIRVSGIRWFTNIKHLKCNLPLVLYKHYNPTEYPKYDNYNAIECSKTVEIPIDYDGVIGVPITFLDKYCPDQFEILCSSYKYSDCGVHIDGKSWNPIVNNKNIYARIFIRHKK